MIGELMPKHCAVGGFIIFFLASLIQCFAQESFTLNHPGSGIFPSCVSGVACGGNIASCQPFSEPWTLDRSTIFDNEMVHGTYQNNYYEACPGLVGAFVEQVGLFDPTGTTFAPGFFYGVDGPCPEAFPTPPQGSVRICVENGFSDTANFQLQLNTAQDLGLSDPRRLP
jgi:hypothetical protein